MLLSKSTVHANFIVTNFERPQKFDVRQAVDDKILSLNSYTMMNWNDHKSSRPT